MSRFHKCDLKIQQLHAGARIVVVDRDSGDDREFWWFPTPHHAAVAMQNWGARNLNGEPDGWSSARTWSDERGQWVRRGRLDPADPTTEFEIATCEIGISV